MVRGIRAMAAAVKIRTEFSAAELRRLAAASKHANQSRRLLSIAAVVDGMRRADAARIGGMDRQTLRDWVHRFNERGPEGLKDSWSKGNPPRLSGAELAAFAELVETGPDRATHGVVRWRRVDLQRTPFGAGQSARRLRHTLTSARGLADSDGLAHKATHLTPPSS